MQQSAAAARPVSRRLRGLRSPPPYAPLPRLAGRLGPGCEASPWSERPAWTWHGPRALRASPPSRKGFFFSLSPFPLPAIFRRGLPRGRGAGRCARCVRGRGCVLQRHFACARWAGSSWGRPAWAWTLREPCKGGSGGVAWGAAAAFAELWPNSRLCALGSYWIIAARPGGNPVRILKSA